jgi:dTDP-4-amino-4,6-dideoxygalactose transaminase
MIRLFKVAMAPEAKDVVGKVLDSGYIGQGPKVEEFEEALQRQYGLPDRPMTTNSCTSAIDLALALIGVGPGDYVITTPQTCTATNSPIVTRGAIPVWADVDLKGLIDPGSVGAVYRQYPQAKAVMAVDWAGQLADYDGLRKATKREIPIIEDAAHRLPDGNVKGDYVAWSFQAIKFLTTGDGGALLTPGNQQARARLLRWYGLDREGSASFRCAQNIAEVGYKYHMNDIAASIGLANLLTAEKNLRQHQANAKYLCDRLGIAFDRDSHYWFFPITVGDRDAFVTYMADKGVETSQVHARNDTHDGFLRVMPRKAGSGTDWFDAHQIAIPCGWWLTEQDLETIADAVLQWR